MIALFADHPIAADSPPACLFLVDAAFSDPSMGCIETPRRDLAGRRDAARFREGGRADKGGEQETTDRGLDKRPQCAALSVGCFCWCFWQIRQCAASARNVRCDLNALPILVFPHIAEAGHG